MALSETLVDSQ